MKSVSVVRTITTVCGKTITYLQDPGENAKMHSMTGPALIYPEGEKKSPEYYLFGVKYSKQQWQELVNVTKPTASTDAISLDF